jgi:hypothetical protein
VSEWLTIEVFDRILPESRLRFAHSETLIDVAVLTGATDWACHEHHWGVVLELQFAGAEQRARFRCLPAVRAVLAAVPDPVGGLLLYDGRAGGSQARVPRRPRPAPATEAASAAVPVAVVLDLDHATAAPHRNWSPLSSSAAV